MTVRSVLVRYMADVGPLVAGNRAAAASTAQLGTATAATNGRLAATGAAARNAAAGTGLLSARFLGPAGLILGLKQATSSAMAFEDTQIKLRTQIGLSEQAAGALADSARNIGTQYAIGGQEAVDASWYIASAGLRGTDATSALEESAKAAALGLGETATIADLVTSAMNAYGPEVLDAGRATDILVAAVRAGKAEAPELAASLGQVLPIASQMGVSFDEVAASVAAMTRTGSSPAEAGTMLRGMLVGILRPAEQAEQALNELGLTSAELRAVIQEQGLLTAMQQLSDAVGGNEEALSRIFPNIRGMSGFMDMMGASAASTAQVFGDVADSVGVANEAFAILEDTSTRFQLDRLRAQFGNVLREVGGPLNDALRETARLLNDIMSGGGAPDPRRLSAAQAGIDGPIGIDDFRRTTEGAAGRVRSWTGLNFTQGLDDLGVLIGALDEFETGAGRRYLRWLAEASAAGDEHASTTLRRLQDEYAGTGTATERLIGQLVNEEAAWRGLTATGDRYTGLAAEQLIAKGDLQGAADLLGMSVAELETKLDGAAGALDEQADAARNLEEGYAALSAGLLEHQETILRVTDPIYNLEKAFADVEAATQAVDDAAQEHGKNSPEYEAALWNQIQALDALELAALNGEISFQEFEARLDSWVKRGQITQGEADVLRRRVADLRAETERFAGDYIANIIATGNAWERVAALAQALRVLPRDTTVRVRYESMYSGATGQNIPGVIGMRASGGPVQHSAAYLVGEQGPELFVPMHSGRIVTAPQTQTARRGGDGAAQPGLTVNQTFAADVSRKTAAEARHQARLAAMEMV